LGWDSGVEVGLAWVSVSELASGPELVWESELALAVLESEPERKLESEVTMISAFPRW
jgi:hypothetical protein